MLQDLLVYPRRQQAAFPVAPEATPAPKPAPPAPTPKYWQRISDGRTGAGHGVLLLRKVHTPWPVFAAVCVINAEKLQVHTASGTITK